MGFFSFNTCDTNESIANCHSQKFNARRPVFLLQPNGAPAIKEVEYNGYGEFGGVDVYEWLSQVNFGGLGDRSAGIALEHSRNLKLGMNDNLLVVSCKKSDFCEHDDSDEFVKEYVETFFAKNEKTGDRKVIWNDCDVNPVIEDLGTTLEEAFLKEVLERTSVEENFIHYPIKLSYCEAASYSSFSKSQDCEKQGFLYDDDE